MRHLVLATLMLVAHAAIAGAAPPPDVAAAPDDAQRTPSGLRWKVLRAGPDGPHPVATSQVTVHYTGWTTDGVMFDSSVERGQPAQFPLNGVIKGWSEGLQLMHKGDLVRMWIPEGLAYRGQAGAPAGTLVFDVELIAFVTPPPVPIDVGRVPPVAIRSDSGLAWRVLRAGAGDVRPGPDDTVVVQWSGWLPDGTLLDSTSLRGAALELPLREAPPGWAEAIQQMAPGEKRRLWVPGALDGGRHPFGAGMLVYEIELMEIKPGSP